MRRNYQHVCQSEFVLECVVNISEGRDRRLLSLFDQACGDALLDRHSDRDHNRSVFTLIGTEAVRSLARLVVERLDLNQHDGAHPRLGVVDVVPFVPLESSSMDDAFAARDNFAHWLADDLGVPSFLYGPGRTLPDIRRHAWASLLPDVGIHHPHPTAGAVCVGVREQLVAYNCWLEPGTDIRIARDIARRVRQPGIRSLGLQVGDRVQVSMNLVMPFTFGPRDAVRAVEDECRELGVHIGHNELVGLVSERVLKEIPRHEWTWLDLSKDRTIESRLAKRR
jgi:glutamate formiminotransferase